MTRGERNNNPGNIRLSDTRFQGEIDGEDLEFKTFSSPVMGIRAIARILLTYYNNYGLNTIWRIINRWAPPNENNTAAYVNNVVKMCNLSSDEIIDLTDENVLDKVVTAIIHQEEGKVIYTPDQICSAIDLALGSN